MRVGVAESESSTTPNTKPRGGKLARRARSFKEDFLEILSQMRSPGGGNAQRAGSPHSPKTRTSHKVASIDTVDGAMEKNPLRDLDLHVKQVCHIGITVSMALKIHCCLFWCYTLQHVHRPLWSVKSKEPRRWKSSCVRLSYWASQFIGPPQPTQHSRSVLFNNTCTLWVKQGLLHVV